MRKFMGGVIGFLVGGVLVFYVFLCIVLAVGGPISSGDMTTGGFVVILFGPPAALVGAIIGAVAGVRIASGGKDKPADAVMIRPQHGVISPDAPKPQPGQSKCPFCHSTTFYVEEEAGSRRCSDCHSVLPNYIHGNR
jgi:hypothetical protein